MWQDADNVELIIQGHQVRKVARHQTLRSIELSIAMCTSFCDIANLQLDCKHYKNAERTIDVIGTSVQRIRLQCARQGRCPEIRLIQEQMADLGQRADDIAARCSAQIRDAA